MSGTGGFMDNPRPPKPAILSSPPVVVVMMGIVSGRTIGAWFVGSSIADP